jgi:RimJ/RimL family protein N-acetyltransferase
MSPAPAHVKEPKVAENPEGTRFLLRDGTSVIVRRIRPDDKVRLQDGLKRLSEQSRYFRFLAPIQRLSSDQLRHLTELDHVNHEAWAGFDGEGEDQSVLGVARYIRLDEEPDVAEAAVAVVDSHHNRGLGTLLIGLLITSAIDNDIRTFRGFFHIDNEIVRRIFEEVDAEIIRDEGFVMRADTPLPADKLSLQDPRMSKVAMKVAKALSSKA